MAGKQTKGGNEAHVSRTSKYDSQKLVKLCNFSGFYGGAATGSATQHAPTKQDMFHLQPQCSAPEMLFQPPSLMDCGQEGR